MLRLALHGWFMWTGYEQARKRGGAEQTTAAGCPWRCQRTSPLLARFLALTKAVYEPTARHCRLWYLHGYGQDLRRDEPDPRTPTAPSRSGYQTHWHSRRT